MASDSNEDAIRGAFGTRSIALLPDALVDQIAAGEVVERPASIVKELVENALDARATRIGVEVRDGGIAWISVTDDGHGMSPGDARLAIQRHATSKVRAVEDLSEIRSFGFRGEALPAIASVSRFRLVTATQEGEGFELLVEAGRLLREGAVGAPRGTRIEVAELFAAVPARRKFLKRPGTEWGHIADWLGRLALSLPEIHFELRRDAKPPIIWPTTQDRLERVAAVLSEADAASLIAAERSSGEAHVSVLVSAPERSRANASGIHAFVNGRPVRDPLLRQAVVTAYRDVLPRGRFPIGLVFLTLPPQQVDVNVHPAKWEVRFSDPKAIHQLIRHTVRDAMAGRSWLGSGEPVPAPGAPAPAWPAFSPTNEGVRDASTPASARLPHTAPMFTNAAAEQGGGAGEASAPRMSFASLPLLGQLHASYLLLESGSGLLLVDQHAAHERVLYERLRKQWLERGVERQGLLAATPVELPASSVQTLLEGADEIGRLGFDLEEFGDGALLVRSVPALLSGHDPVALVQGLAEELDSRESLGIGANDETRLLAAADRVFATVACHSARRFGDRLPPEEQRAILAGLDAIPWAPTCPHGRPVAIALERDEIERRFARR